MKFLPFPQTQSRFIKCFIQPPKYVFSMASCYLLLPLACHHFLGIITSSVSSHPTPYLRQVPIPYSTLVTFFFRRHNFFSFSGSPSVTLLIANTVHWVSTKGSAFVLQLISASSLLFLNV